MRLTKHNTCILLLFMSAILMGYSQKSKYADRGWKVGVMASPGLSYRFLTENKDQAIIGSFDDRNKREIIKFGGQAGMSAIYQFNDHYSIVTDLRYASAGFRTIPKQCEGNYDSLWTCRRYYNFSYIEIPVAFRYTLGLDRLQVTFGVFVSPGIRLRYKRILHIQPTDSRRFQDIEVNYTVPDWNLFAGVRAGLNYNLADKMNLEVQPEFKVGLRTDYGHSHLWNLGISFSYYYTI